MPLRMLSGRIPGRETLIDSTHKRRMGMALALPVVISATAGLILSLG